MRKEILYIEIANTIKKEIQNKKYAVGEMLPTEIELEKLFHVSKVTIRNAIELLSNQGYVEKKSGKGTTVISNRLFNKLSKSAPFSTMLEHQGLKVEKKILSIETIELDATHPYFPYFGAVATLVTRMYFVNGQPYVLFHHHLPKSSYQGMKEKLNHTSMYNILAESQEVVDHFHDQFSVSQLTDKEKIQLDTEETHVMKRTRKAYNQHNQVIEVSISLYNTSLYPYEIDFEI